MDLWHLPDVLDLVVRWVSYEPPKLRYVSPTEVAEYTEGIEFEIRTETPLPTRALPPVILVGNEIVGDMEEVGGNRYIFRGFEPDRLNRGAPIALGWPTKPGQTRETKFRYEPPKAST